MNEVNVAELYNLDYDPMEQNDVAHLHSEMVAKISKIADSIRGVLGDRLTGVKGSEVRPVGRVDE